MEARSEFERLYVEFHHGIPKRLGRIQERYKRQQKLLKQAKESYARLCLQESGYSPRRLRSDRPVHERSRRNRSSDQGGWTYKKRGLQSRIDELADVIAAQQVRIQEAKELRTRTWIEMLERVEIPTEFHDSVVVKRDDVQDVTDFYFGGPNHPLDEGHGHYIVSNATGFVFYARNVGEPHGAHNYRRPYAEVS